MKVLKVKLKDFELFGETVSALIDLLANTSINKMADYAKNNAKQLRKFLRATTNLKPWQLWFMPAFTAIEIACEVVRVNHDFFNQALAQMVSALGGQA